MTKTEILILLTLALMLFGFAMLLADTQINSMTVSEMPVWLWYILN